jgi:hypothetical protein
MSDLDLSSGDIDPAHDVAVEGAELENGAITRAMLDKLQHMSLEEYAQHRESLMKGASKAWMDAKSRGDGTWTTEVY